jgi:hypothetical protein
MTEEDAESKTKVAIAMVATSSPRLPNVSAILAACGESFVNSESSIVNWDKGVLVFPCQDARVGLTLVPLPIPWLSIEGPCATAWWWPEATEKMKSHKCHFIIVIMGGTIDHIERMLILTRIVSAAILGTDAVGVYWGEGTLVHEPEKFVTEARSARKGNIPGFLWVDVRVEKNPDNSLRCFTTGMSPLGFHEIEVAKADLKPLDLMDFVGNVVLYIGNSQPKLKDGETIGRSATEKYKVQFGPSMFDRPAVMRIIMD